MKRIILCFFLGLLFLGTGYGYFEHKYYCLASDKVTVSLKKQNDQYAKCMDLISKFATNIKSVNENISIAQSFINKNEDKEYWQKVYNGLIKKRDALNKYNSLLMSSVKAFDEKMFIKISKIVKYYAQNDIKKLSKKYNIINIQANNYFVNGDSENYKKSLQELSEIKVQLIFLQNITTTETLNDIVPLVNFYTKYFSKK